jgi:hypothetical protein
MSQSFPLANRALPLIDLSWTDGRISMSGATDAPLDRKESSYGA